MSTHALIAIQDIPYIKGISLQFDGSIDFAGKILKKHYATKNKIDKLISLGNLESLAPTLKNCITAPISHRQGNEAIETYDLDELFRCFDWEYAYVFDVSDYTWYVHHIKMVREEL